MLTVITAAVIKVTADISVEAIVPRMMGMAMIIIAVDIIVDSIIYTVTTARSSMILTYVGVIDNNDEINEE